eukprot:CAMPEP_0170631426 /NCGR_PEP_ID=MMETSP0224-20130122/34630_1 /TAXON_ID=285029 /ORGANISM="Togula jolla, Strain CCCM 725" /LENGTH=79 /DNA_ID=CAMNT_0010959755 /DNA_START=15 /DNA_END=251 /DNA_ORIENTATION=-
MDAGAVAPLKLRRAAWGRRMTDITLDGASFNDSWMNYASTKETVHRIRTRILYSKPGSAELGQSQQAFLQALRLMTAEG